MTKPAALFLVASLVIAAVNITVYVRRVKAEASREKDKIRNAWYCGELKGEAFVYGVWTGVWQRGSVQCGNIAADNGIDWDAR